MHCSRRKQIKVHEPLYARNFESELSKNKLIQTCQFDDHLLSRTPNVSMISSKEREKESFNNSRGIQTHFRLVKAQSVKSRSQKNESQKTQQSTKISVEKSKKTARQACYQLLQVKPSSLEDNMKVSSIKSRLLRRYSLQIQKLQQFSEDHLKKYQENQVNQQKNERIFCKKTITLTRPNSFSLINQRGPHKLFRRNTASKATQQQWKDLCPWPQVDIQDLYF